MGNISSKYDIRLDGELITDLPKPVAEAFQSFMKGHDTLIVIRKPDIMDRDVIIDDQSDAIDESVKRVEDAITLQRNQITDMFNAAVSSLNSEVNELKKTINDHASRPQNDTASIKTMIDLLAGRLNDISNALPLTLQDKFNTQTDRLIESIADTLKPKDSINASIKGATYELEVTAQFESLNIPTLSIERVSTEHHVCDIHVIDTVNDILYAVECKNYTSTIGRDQLDKFKRDLDELKIKHSNKTVVGLFLSKQTRIVEHGMMNVDSDGNVYLAGEYNTPDMWRALILYFGRLKQNNRLISQQADDNEERTRVLLSAYQAMKDAESIGSIIGANILRVNDMLKDLQLMASKIKPLGEIIEQFDKIYQFNVQSKPKRQYTKRAKKEVTVESDQIDAEPITLSFSDSDGEDSVQLKPKRTYTKRSKKDDTIKVVAKNNPLFATKDENSSIGWSDDE